MISIVKDHLGVPRKLNYVWGGPTSIAPYDHAADEAVHKLATAPPFLTLLAKMPPVTDQGQQGACTGHSSIAPYYVAQTEAKKIMPSAAYMYYNERLLNGQTDQDAGANISDIYRAGNKYGICDESLMPYSDSDFTTPPSADAYAAGKLIRAHIYAPIPQLVENLVGCLHHGGFPINFGIVVYPSFQANDSGLIPMPGKHEDAEGGHAIGLVGYNQTLDPQVVDGLTIPARHFVFRNSWGVLWGAKGYGFLPFPYVLSPQLASDFWMIRSI